MPTMNLAPLLPMAWILTVWLLLVGTLRLAIAAGWDFSHFWQQFDKLLLVFLVLFYSLLGLLVAYQVLTNSHPYVQKFADAMLDNQKLVIGALLGLITGRAIQRQIDSTQNGAQNGTPKV